jgi:hypothetical protein
VSKRKGGCAVVRALLLIGEDKDMIYADAPERGLE